MDMAQLDRARRLERTFERRAARAKRSKWLGRLLFSLTGVGLLLLLRMNPTMVADTVSYLHGSGTERAGPSVIAKPSDVHVRTMPSSAVPVRRGGTLPGNGTRAPQHDTHAQAEGVANTLRGLSPGG